MSVAECCLRAILVLLDSEDGGTTFLQHTVTTHPLTQHHIPVDLNPHQDRCEDLRSHMSCYTSQEYYALLRGLSCRVEEVHVLCVIMATSHILCVKVRHSCL